MNTLDKIGIPNESLPQFYEKISYKITTSKCLSNNLEKILNNLNEAIYATNINGRIIFVNYEFEKIFNYNKHSVLGMHIRDFNKNHNTFIGIYHKVLEKKEKVEIKYSFKNKILLIKSYPIFEKNKIEAIITHVNDISEVEILKNDIDYKKKFSANADLNESINNLTNNFDKNPFIHITGLDGTGKEAAAKYIHLNSNSSHEKFIKVDCNKIYDFPFESILKYHFNSNIKPLNRNDNDIVRDNNQITLFLKDIDKMPLDFQYKLLLKLNPPTNALSKGSYIPTQNRIISSSKQDISSMVSKNLFLKDLYAIINQSSIHIPELKTRKEDILYLSNKFLKELNYSNKCIKKIEKKVYFFLRDYEWPQNLSELKETIATIHSVCDSDLIDMSCVPPYILDFIEGNNAIFTIKKSSNMNLKSLTNELEHFLINYSYEKYQSVKDASKHLGISPSCYIKKKRQI